MTCHDARERLSELLDDALEPSPRALVEAHLTECAECRREWERLRATVGLLQRVEPPRAPAGFVDRVIERAYPRPWYRRLGGWLFLPLSVKLPAEAAALVLIAGLTVYLWERTPALRDAARIEPPAPVSSPPAPAQPSAPTEPPAPAQPSAPTELPAPAQPAAPPPPGESREAPPAPLPAPAPPVAAESDSTRRDESERRQKSAVARAPSTAAPAATRPSAPANVLGRLTVSDLRDAARGLADLISRVGGSETARRLDDVGTAVDVVIPATRYDEFVRGLEALGSWTVESQPTAQPPDTRQIEITIRIQ